VKDGKAGDEVPRIPAVAGIKVHKSGSVKSRLKVI